MPHLDTPQSCCRFGLARCDVTPPVGIYHRMWGAASHERASGVHRPLTATALVFQAPDETPSSATEQVLVAVDHCLLWAKEMDALLATVSRRTGLAPGQVVVAFSHTHAAGLMGLERTTLPGGELIPPYLDQLAERVAGIVQDARRAVQPVTITYGTGRCPMAGQRDFWDADSQQFVCGFNPEGSSDDTLVVARVHGPQGQALATVVNYACHPTTLAWENTLISPDFPGALRELVERETAVPCAFVQGASGDLGPRDGYKGDPALADRNGRQLGYAALAVLEALPAPGTRFQYTGPVVSGATLGTWAQMPLDAQSRQRNHAWRLRRWTVDLAYRPEIPTLEKTLADRAHWQAEEEKARQAGDLGTARDCRAMRERMDRWLTRLEVLPPGKTFPLPVTLWQSGGAFWLAVESEHYQLLQQALRERFAGVPVVVATVANGSRATYLPPAHVYGQGIYQETIAVLAPGSLEHLIENVALQIQQWLTA